MKWNLIELRRRQEEAAKRVSLVNELPALEELQTVASADISCGRFSKQGYAAVMVFRYPDMELLDQASFSGELVFPYIPGFLAFREYPLIEPCINELKIKPDVLICDGQGIAHPRNYGIACHIGIETGLITIGCGKSRLCGEYTEPALVKGSKSDLLLDGNKIGEVIRTKDKVNPLFISPGHRVGFDQATRLILSLCGKYRQPEPIRRVHELVNIIRQKSQQSFDKSSQEV